MTLSFRHTEAAPTGRLRPGTRLRKGFADFQSGSPAVPSVDDFPKGKVQGPLLSRSGRRQGPAVCKSLSLQRGRDPSVDSKVVSKGPLINPDQVFHAITPDLPLVNLGLGAAGPSYGNERRPRFRDQNLEKFP